MEHSKLRQIDSLITDEHFRNAIQSLEPHEPIPDLLVKSFAHVDKYDMELARQLIIASGKNAESTDYSNKDRIWQAIEKASIQFDNNRKSPGANFTIHKNLVVWKKVMMYAAVIVGLVFLIAWTVMEQDWPSDPVEISEEMVRKANPTGQKSRITLPDGSIVHLNAESELVYDKNFLGDQRKLYLIKGEAYFKVKKNKEKPFIVIMDQITVTALGTKFNVNTFYKDLEVALVEGSVLVNNTSRNDQLIMEPSEVLKFNPESNRMVISSNNAIELAEWKDQVLRFNNTPINEAVNTLSRWYAVEISLENTPPPDLTVSGKFNNSSLELVLSNLGYSLDFEYKIESKEITIKFKK